jgi:hypothetical protein
MKNPRSIFFAFVLATLLTAFPAFAEDAPVTKEQLLAHPEVMGAIAAINAYVQGVLDSGIRIPNPRAPPQASLFG